MKTVFLTMSTTRVIEPLLAKTKISGQTQFLDLAQSLLEFFAVMIIFGKKQNVLTAVPGQLGRQNQEVGSDSIQSSRPILFGQAKPFEPVDNIGREQQQLEEHCIYVLGNKL